MVYSTEVIKRSIILWKKVWCIKWVWAFIKDEDKMEQTAFSKGRQYLFSLGSCGPVSISLVLKHLRKIQHCFSTMTYLAVPPGYFRLSLELYIVLSRMLIYTPPQTDLKNQSGCFSRLNLELKSRWQCRCFHLVYTGE